MSNKQFRLSVNVIILGPDDHLLFLKRSPKSRINPGKWDLPGGKVDACEDFHEALVREVIEETGLTISITGLAGASQSSMNGTNVIFLIMKAELKSGEVRLSNEHDEFLWTESGSIDKLDLCVQFKDVVHDYINKMT